MESPNPFDGLFPLPASEEWNAYDLSQPHDLAAVGGSHASTVPAFVEQDVVLAPAPYWQNILQPRLDQLLQNKVHPAKCVRSDHTSVVVAVTERLKRDLMRRFNETKIDWAVVEKQLVAWSDLFRTGKRLRVHLSFNYVETILTSAASTARKGNKRGGSTTIQRMLGERAAQLDAEEESSGHPSIWRQVYGVMRCPGPPCQLGPHCRRDPVGKKHYRLGAHHLRELIKHVEQDGVLQTHDDVPDDVRWPRHYDFINHWRPGKDQQDLCLSPLAGGLLAE